MSLKRRNLQTSKLLAVLAVTTLIFVGGIILGNYFAGQKLTELGYLGQELRTDTLAIEIQYDLAEANPCGNMPNTPLADQLYELATKLDYMENRLGEDNQDVIDLKEYYMMLELRHWMFNKKINEECGESRSLILYFYSNQKDCPECSQQGFILTWLRHNYPENVLVYAFDYDIENPALDTVKNMYGVTGSPALVINSDTFNGFVSKAELEQVVKDHIIVAKDAQLKKDAKNQTSITQDLINQSVPDYDPVYNPDLTNNSDNNSNESLDELNKVKELVAVALEIDGLENESNSTADNKSIASVE
ncbi:hypothetical protein HN587_02170 [Candidatus Woesearchaeota archaeon]|jgi:hypothetical protein|nr:hypothetical protein [Candidatus Woesearchaeota archaeon]